MRLFYFINRQYHPLTFFICKLNSIDEEKKLEELSNELFGLLFEKNYANNKTILIFSIIKDWEEKTENWIKPAINSNNEMVERCHNNTDSLNKIITTILKSSDSEFYIEIYNNKISWFDRKIGLTDLAHYYKV